MKQWVVKASLSALLACSPFLTATAAFAEEGILTVVEPTADEVQTPMQTLEPAETMDAAATNETEGTAEDEQTETTETTDENEEKPSLVQGDFFYFVKTTAEDIRLAMETNDLDKAKLLAEMAAERIAEAKVLIEEGEEEYTTNTLKKAVEQINQADGLSQEVEGSQSEKAEVQVKLGQQVEALARVLDKVKNPKAQAAIAKNLEKSFTKFAEKIEQKQDITIIEDEQSEEAAIGTDVQPTEVETEVVTNTESEIENVTDTVAGAVHETEAQEEAAVNKAVTAAAVAVPVVAAAVQKTEKPAPVVKHEQKKQEQKEKQEQKKVEKEEKKESREQKKDGKHKGKDKK